MKSWSEIRKDGLWQGIIGGTVSILIATAILAIFPSIRGWVVGLLGALWSILRAVTSPLTKWLAATIPVSRGQCVVWFLVGFGICVVAVLAVAIWERALALSDVSLSSEEQLVLSFFARNRGYVFDSDDVARTSGLSVIKVNYTIEGLRKRGLVDGNALGWSLTERGQSLVISKGWA